MALLPAPTPPLCPYTTLFRSEIAIVEVRGGLVRDEYHTVVNPGRPIPFGVCGLTGITDGMTRSEEHTSELQSPCNIVCRLLLEKKNAAISTTSTQRTYDTRSY